MSAPPATEHTPAEHARGAGRSRNAGQVLSLAILVVLTTLLVEVLLEAWVQELASDRVADAEGHIVSGELVTWPKDLKNGLYLLLAALTAGKIAVERRWREFTSSADLALVGLALVMVVAGLLGTSGPVLIGEAIFVYLRGAIAFYAVRALRPSWPQVRRVLWIVGGLLVVNAVVGVAQLTLGRPAFTGVGIVDLYSQRADRAQGLLPHPNDLGHVLGLGIIGVVAWLSGLPRADQTGRRARVLGWAALVAGAAGVASGQSRESVLAVLAACLVIWFLRRRSGRVILLASAIVATVFLLPLLAKPGQLERLATRISGVLAAVETPSGQEATGCEPAGAECVPATEQREMRVLFFQQGVRLLAERPVLGYGVGQFGGIVAEKHDPNWEQDERFPGGFNLHGFDGTTVDSFWLHLTVETGLLGLIAAAVWLWLLLVPLLGITARFAGRRVWGARAAREPADERTTWVALWGVGGLLFIVLVGLLSTGLEGPLFPPLVFAVLGLAWAETRDVPEKPKPGPRHARSATR